MPTRSAPDVTDATESCVPEIAAVTTGSAVAVSATLKNVCDTLTVQVHGKVLKIEHEPAVTVVCAESPAPAMTMLTSSEPDATAETVSVVPEMAPVNDADGNAGSDASPAGQ
jgi:hypothetical protein